MRTVFKYSDMECILPGKKRALVPQEGGSRGWFSKLPAGCFFLPLPPFLHACLAGGLSSADRENNNGVLPPFFAPRRNYTGRGKLSRRRRPPADWGTLLHLIATRRRARGANFIPGLVFCGMMFSRRASSRGRCFLFRF